MMLALSHTGGSEVSPPLGQEPSMLLGIPSWALVCYVHPHHFSSLVHGALLSPQPVTFATVGKGSHVAVTPDCRHALSEKSP